MNIEIGKWTVLLLAAILGTLALSSGVALAATITCQAGVDCLGTKNADTLEGTDSKDIMHGRGGGDTLKGFGNVDQLYGQGGRDTLSGGSDIDYLYGGAGNDMLNGGGGVDLYLFGDGWGKDSITNETTSGANVYFSSDIEGEAPATDEVIVDLESGAGPEAKDKSGTNTINWEGNVVNKAFGGDGDDEISGNASANVIYGFGGADTVFGGEGNDDIHVVDGSSGDTVHCGAGEDTVYYDVVIIGLSLDSVDSDCEHLVAA